MEALRGNFVFTFFVFTFSFLISHSSFLIQPLDIQNSIFIILK